MKLPTPFSFLRLGAIALVFTTSCGIDPDANAGYGVDKCPKERQYKDYCLGADGGSANNNNNGSDGGGGNKNDGGGSGTSGGMDGSMLADAQVDGSASDASMLDDAAADGGDAAVVDSCAGMANGAKTVCYTGPVGTEQNLPCRTGQKTCTDGVWSTCTGEVLPPMTDEMCNGVDDDCNGMVDDGVPTNTCDVTDAKGACKPGLNACISGSMKCLALVGPVSETCDGDDEADDQDCDGAVDSADPDLIQECYDGASGCTLNLNGTYSCSGACVAGRLYCVSGVMETACDDDTVPSPEVGTSSGDPVDENCNGQIDEGFCAPGNMVHCYDGPSGTEGVGTCHGDTIECISGTYEACDQVTPQVETCQNLVTNDDCDANAGEDVTGIGDPCTPDPGALSFGVCKAAAKRSCDGATGDDPICKLGPITDVGDDVCDDKDGDCDGTIDEGVNKMTNRNHCGACGRVCSGSDLCCNGNCIAQTKNNCGSCGNVCNSGGKTCCVNSACKAPALGLLCL